MAGLYLMGAVLKYLMGVANRVETFVRGDIEENPNVFVDMWLAGASAEEEDNDMLFMFDAKALGAGVHALKVLVLIDLTAPVPNGVVDMQYFCALVNTKGPQGEQKLASMANEWNFPCRCLCFGFSLQ